MCRMPSWFTRAGAASASAFGVMNFESSTWPLPSGVRSMTTSLRTSSSPMTLPAHSPSTRALHVLDDDADVVHLWMPMAPIVGAASVRY